MSLITITILSSCYDDKGNYDYKDLVKVSVQIGDVKDIALGDVLKANPTITLSKEMSESDFSYKWMLEGEVIGTERNLSWVSDRFTKELSDNLIFEVVDLKNDIAYRDAVSVSINGKYEVDGYLVLTDKGGKKYLNLMRQSSDEEGNEIYIPLMDPVGLENNGEAISPSSSKVFEHYCRQDATYKNQIMLIADDQTFEVDGTSFKKVDYGLHDMFNGAIPADLQNSVKDAHFMQYLDFITDKKGQIYSRVKSTFEVFHSDYFLNSPVSFEGEVLKDIDIIPSSYGVNTPFCMLHDKNKKRFLAIWDYQDGFDEVFVSGKIQAINNSQYPWPEGVIPVSDVCKDYTFHRIDAYKRDLNYPYSTRYSCIIQSNISGEYYYYDFGLQKPNYASIEVFWSYQTIQDGNQQKTVVDATMEKIPENVLSFFTNPDNVIYTLPWGQNGWCTLIGQGSDLYVYNRKAPFAGSESLNPNPRKVNYSPGSEVGVMNANTYQSNFMGVAFKDGTFQVLDIRQISQGICKPIWKSESNLNLGTPISMWFHTTGNLNLDWRAIDE